MYCPKCGKELSHNAKFCANCGANLENELHEGRATQEQTQVQPQAQPQAQAQPQPRPQLQSQPTQPKTNEKPKSKRPMYIAIGVGAVVLVAAVIAVVVLVAQPFKHSDGVWVPVQVTKQVQNGNTNYTDTILYSADEVGNVTVADEVAESEDAEDRLSNDFAYDEDGFCTSYTEESNGKTVKYDCAWEKDENGRATLLKVTENGKDHGSKKYEYNSEGYLSKTTTTNTDKSVVTNEFDAEGHIVRATQKDKDGTTYEYTYAYERDDKNRIIKATATSVNTKTKKTVLEIVETFEYDEDDNVIVDKQEGTRVTDDGKTVTIKSDDKIDYEYVDNPTEWRKQLQRLYMGNQFEPF